MSLKISTDVPKHSLNPPPPQIGDVFRGPAVGLNPRQKALYHVRAVVDNEGEDPEFGWIYWVVFRFYSKRKGWRYTIESAHAIGIGLYVKTKAKRAK